MARNPLSSSTPLPSWWDNPIGTQREDQTYASSAPADSTFDPVVGYWPTGKPMLKSEYDGMKTASLTLFDRLSMASGAPRNPLVSRGNVVFSRHVGHTPPSKPQRAVESDYPQGVPLDETGRIARTIEGVPLTAQNVAGRRAMDNSGTYPDRAVDQAAIESIGADARGAKFLGVPRSRLPEKVAGTYDPRTGEIRYNQSLLPAQQDIVKTHEVSHIIDELAGSIPTKGLSKELDFLYSTLYSGQERTKHLTRPKDLEYKPHEGRGELMAEAVRGYLQNPNWIKEMAPDTAKAIRKAVNSNPSLNNWIQFNTLAAMAGGMGASNMSGDE